MSKDNPGSSTVILPTKEITDAIEQAEKRRKNEELRKKVDAALAQLVKSQGISRQIGSYAVAVGALRDSEQLGVRLIPTKFNDLKEAVGEFFKGYSRVFTYSLKSQTGYTTRDFFFL